MSANNFNDELDNAFNNLNDNSFNQTFRQIINKKDDKLNDNYRFKDSNNTSGSNALGNLTGSNTNANDFLSKQTTS